MKKVLTMILCVTLILTFFTSTVSAASEGISPRFNNANATDSNFLILGGEAIVSLSYSGKSGYFTSAKITTVLEKRTLLLFWSDVTEWTDTSTSANGSFNHTYPVDSGTYRVKITYEISGTGGATDVIEETIKASS